MWPVPASGTVILAAVELTFGLCSTVLSLCSVDEAPRGTANRQRLGQLQKTARLTNGNSRQEVWKPCPDFCMG